MDKCSVLSGWWSIEHTCCCTRSNENLLTACVMLISRPMRNGKESFIVCVMHVEHVVAQSLDCWIWPDCSHSRTFGSEWNESNRFFPSSFSSGLHLRLCCPPDKVHTSGSSMRFDGVSNGSLGGNYDSVLKIISKEIQDVCVGSHWHTERPENSTFNCFKSEK